MYELRILNGLHRGAILPLDDITYTIGASEDADIVLADPGIEIEHATAQLIEGGWLLRALDGGVMDADSNQPQEVLTLQLGDCARIGQIWISVVEAEAAWQNPPPDPVDVPAAVLEDVPTEDSEDQFDAQADELEPMMDGPLDEPEAMAEAIAGGASEGMKEDAAARDAAPRGIDRLRRFGARLKSRRTYFAVAAVTVLSACAYTLTAEPEPMEISTTRAGQLDLGAKSGAHTAGVAASQNATRDRPVALTPAELQIAFRARLEEVSLLQRLDLDLQEARWTMKAAFDDEESARFGRVLAEFVKQHNITFPIEAKVGNPESMLPFKIRQVVSGADASVVTDDGYRIYIGDTYRGMRLVSVDGNRLSFNGRRKIEVRW